nr:MAG TPA: hypothetical protein [Caudoviricetes sp.]DAM59817.1 MAG TPA: hypothetical protein [Caudoviricetes sp.]
MPLLIVSPHGKPSRDTSRSESKWRRRSGELSRREAEDRGAQRVQDVREMNWRLCAYRQPPRDRRQTRPCFRRNP